MWCAYFRGEKVRFFSLHPCRKGKAGKYLFFGKGRKKGLKSPAEYSII